MTQRPADWPHSVRTILFDQNLDSIDYRKLLDGIDIFSDRAPIPSGSRVLVRADIDVPLDSARSNVLDNERLASLHDTVQTCLRLKVTPIVFGHVGRDKQNTAAPIASELEKLYGLKCVFVADWLDEKNAEVRLDAKAVLGSLPKNCIVLLEHTRRYDLERSMWNKSSDELGVLGHGLYKAASSVAKDISNYYVFDALASHNPDWSSVVVPGACKAAYLGPYTSSELSGPLSRIRQADIVILGGLKIDKLDALEGIVERGHTRRILCGGSIAMALVKAKGLSIGLAENSKFSEKKWFITAERIAQASRILSTAVARGVSVMLPIDYVLDNGEVSQDIPSSRAQMDIGPRTCALFGATIREFLDQNGGKATIFYNGSVGAFEMPQFAKGTEIFVRFLSGLKREFRAAEIYVGGGDGRLAFTTFGDVSAVTHVFTCGGTVLKAIGMGNLNYLKSLFWYSQNSGACKTER
ncbi:MAG: phosphoglycerate kinase [Bacteroidota bacterium]